MAPFPEIRLTQIPLQTYQQHPHLYIDEGMAVCDAVYRPDRETPLVLEACKRGTRAVTGERMLLYQGVQAQRLRTGRQPYLKAMDGAIS